MIDKEKLIKLAQESQIDGIKIAVTALNISLEKLKSKQIDSNICAGVEISIETLEQLKSDFESDLNN